MPVNEHLDLARWACARARQAGAPEARASVFRTRDTSLEYRERKVETLSESTERGMNLTLYIDGKYSSHRTSDLRQQALEKFIDDSVAMTRYLTEDAHRYLPDPEYYAGRQSQDLDLVDSGHTAVVPEDRHRLVQEIENAALERGGDRILSVTAGYSEGRAENSSGRGEQEAFR